MQRQLFLFGCNCFALNVEPKVRRDLEPQYDGAIVEMTRWLEGDDAGFGGYRPAGSVSDRPYTVLAIAKFLNKTRTVNRKDKEPELAALDDFLDAFNSLEFISEGYLTEDVLKGLEVWKIGEVAAESPRSGGHRKRLIQHAYCHFRESASTSNRHTRI